MNKSKANKIHARRRMRERYGGLLLSKDRARRILEKIRLRDGKAKRISVSRSLWKIHLEKENITMRVVYDRKRRSIVTVLPVKE